MTNKSETPSSAQGKGKKKKSFFSRMLTLFMVLCAVLGAVVLGFSLLG